MEITRKPKIIFYTKLSNEMNIRPIVTIGIFCAILLALVLIGIDSVSLLLSIGIPVLLCISVCAAGAGLYCIRHSIECIEATNDFLIIEYYKDGKAFIPWNRISSIEPSNPGYMLEKIYLMVGINSKIYNRLNIHLGSGVIRRIPLT